MGILGKIIKTTLLVTALLAAVFISLIAFTFFSDYKPDEEEIIYLSDNPSILNDSISLTLLTWNIGYAGLDKAMDFFYDGGTKVMTPESICRENINQIGNFLQSNDTIDFIILQEVDRKSKRSYKIDEFNDISEKLKGFNPFFAKNYDVFFVPSPLTDPMGKVVSGIVSYSKYIPESSTRFSLPGDFGFPTQLFYLDRCFMVNRYRLSDGKQLVLINTHNEAFDEGDIRKAQMKRLKKFLLDEFNAGNYIIAGGDWNQCPPDFVPVFSENQINTSQMRMEPDYFSPEWKWLFDPTVPSNRSVISAYDPATTGTTVIDFFLLSPNIQPVSVKCHNLGFVNSDHNPVTIKVRLLLPVPASGQVPMNKENK